MTDINAPSVIRKLSANVGIPYFLSNVISGNFICAVSTFQTFSKFLWKFFVSWKLLSSRNSYLYKVQPDNEMSTDKNGTNRE